jgi:hypothetical protein
VIRERRGAAADRRARAVAGALAGLLAGALTGALLADQDAMAGAAFGASGADSGFTLYLVVSVALGGGFGLVVRYERVAYAADISGGLILGLLRFILGPLTLVPLAAGDAVRWSLAASEAAFPELVASLGYGALTGFGFHLAMGWWRAARPLT